jgi:hypothetical protein
MGMEIDHKNGNTWRELKRTQKYDNSAVKFRVYFWKLSDGVNLFQLILLAEL